MAENARAGVMKSIQAGQPDRDSHDNNKPALSFFGGQAFSGKSREGDVWVTERRPVWLQEGRQGRRSQRWSGF